MDLLLPLHTNSCRLLLFVACLLLGVVQCYQVVFVDQNLQAVLNTTNPAISVVQQIAVDNAGSVYVADQNNYRVVKLSIGNGSQLAVYSQGGIAPAGLAIASGDVLWVTDASSSRIVRYNAQGNMTASVPVLGNSVSASAVAVDGAGRLYYIDDTDPGVVQIDISSGNVTRLLNSTQPYLNRPAALSVDSSGNVHVAYTLLAGRDYRSASVVSFSSAGAVLSMFTYFNYTPNGLSAQPVCLALDSYGNVFLGDTQNNAVYKMDASGNLLALYNSSTQANNFNPRGCAVDNAGHLLIATVQNVILVTTNLNPVSSAAVALVTCIAPLSLTVVIVIVSLMLDIALV